VGGDIDPCGCKVNPQGGLARKARWLSQHGKGWDGILLVDAGDLFAERGNLDPAELPMVWDRALLYLDVFAQLGHDAQGLGDRDFALGVPKLKELEAKAKFPFVCANVVDASTGQPVFKPRVVVEKAGLKIGIFGLAPQATLTRLDLEKANNIRFESPFDAARAQVAALNAEGVSAIVALAHLNLDELEQLAREVPGITLVAGSNSARELPVPVRVKDTWITDGHAQGKFLSVLSLLVGEGETKPSFADPNRRSMLEQKRSALQRRVEAREVAIKKATEEAGGKEDNNLEWLQQNLAKLRAELQELDLEIEETSAPGAVSKSFAVYDYVSMDAAVGDDPNVQALTEALKSKYPILAERAEAKLEEAAVPDPKAPPGPPTTPAAGP
jgi:2',3'-cyclic-nucleotide 2'-phosphodiesterase (5'-nucleotidase family)